MKKTRIILYTLLLVCIVTFAGCVGFLASALLYEKEPPKAPEQENAEPTPAPDPAPEVKPESDPEPDPEPDPFANISFELAPAEKIESNIRLLREYVDRLLPEELAEDRPTIELIEDAIANNKDCGAFPPCEVNAVTTDTKRSKAADTEKATQIKMEMTNEQVWGLVGNPHSAFECCYTSGHYDPLYLKSFYVLSNGQVLTVTFDRNSTRVPWIVVGVAVANLDETLVTHILKELGNYPDKPGEKLRTYDDFIKFWYFDDPGEKVAIEDFEAVFIYRWTGKTATYITYNDYWFVPDGDELVAVYHEFTYYKLSPDSDEK